MASRIYNGQLVKELEELVFDGEKILFNGEKLKLPPVPIGFPKTIDIKYSEDVPRLIIENCPEGADTYAMEKGGYGWRAIQYYRIIA